MAHEAPRRQREFLVESLLRMAYVVLILVDLLVVQPPGVYRSAQLSVACAAAVLASKAALLVGLSLRLPLTEFRSPSWTWALNCVELAVGTLFSLVTLTRRQDDGLLAGLIYFSCTQEFFAAGWSNVREKTYFSRLYFAILVGVNYGVPGAANISDVDLLLLDILYVCLFVIIFTANSYAERLRRENWLSVSRAALLRLRLEQQAAPTDAELRAVAAALECDEEEAQVLTERRLAWSSLKPVRPLGAGAFAEVRAPRGALCCVPAGVLRG